ncbi:MAG: YihY/virulence factor BrkB family protein [Planctomycetaceae bacterium]
MTLKSLWNGLLKRVWNPAAETWDRFERDDGSLMAAAVSYYAGLSLMPLLIVLVSGIGVFLKTTDLGQDAQHQLLAAIEREGSPELRNQMKTILSQVKEGASFDGTLGLLGLIFGTLAIFAQLERAFDRIWNVNEPADIGIWKSLKHLLLQRFRAFIMLCSLGLLIMLIFLAGMAMTAAKNFASNWLPIPEAVGQLLDWSVSVVLNTMAFTLLYRLLPKVKIRWREAVTGAILVAIGWELGRQVLFNILIGTRYSNAYGTIGSFLAVLLWLYYASHLLFIGAEFIQVIYKHPKPVKNPVP